MKIDKSWLPADPSFQTQQDAPLGREETRKYISAILFGLSIMAERAGRQALSTQMFDIAEALIEPEGARPRDGLAPDTPDYAPL